MKFKLFQLFFCLYLFWQPLLSSFLLLFDLPLDGLIMRIALVSIFVLSCLFYLYIKPKYTVERKLILILIVFGVLLYSTQFFYDGNKHSIYLTDSKMGDLFIGVFLRWGADCVPGCLLGITLSKLKDFSIIHKVLPYEAFALTPLMAYTTIFGTIQEGLRIAQGGFDYQNMAYYMAFLFCICFFYSFIYHGERGLVFRILMMSASCLQIVCCLMAGGRGGVVLLIVYILYLSYFMLKRNNASILKLVIVTVIGLPIIYVLANQFDVTDSVGYARSSHLFQDDDRIVMWKSIWHFVEDNNYIGYGLGGDYFTYGFYTHNIILDFILELGIIGAPIMIIIFYIMFKRQLYLSKVNDLNIVIMLFFLYGLVMNLFTGYWITTASNWVVFGLTMMYNKILPRKAIRISNKY